MADCTYTLLTNNGNREIKTSNLLKLSTQYYRSGASLVGQKIFSTAEVVDSVKSELNRIAARTDEIKKDESKKPITSFISDINTIILNSVGLKQDRLAPQYDEDNRILHYILESMAAQYKLSITSLSALQTLVANNPGLQTTYDERFAEIKEIIEAEKLTNSLGIDLHKVLARALRGDDLESAVEKVVEDFAKKNPDVLDNLYEWKKALFSKMSSIHAELKVIIDNGGTLMSELDIDTDADSSIPLKGIIDIVAIDSDGRAHIYDFKISKNPYANWDQAKTLTTDWQLAFYRGLLGQYIDVSDATLNIIPLAIGGIHIDNSGPTPRKQLLFSNLKYSGQVSLLSQPGKGLGKDGKLTITVNALVKQKLHVSFNPAKYDDLIQDLKILLEGHDPRIGDYEIKTTRAEYNVERMVEAASFKNKYEIFNNYAGDIGKELSALLEPLGFKETTGSNILKYDWPAGISKENKIKIFTEAAKIYSEFAKKHKNGNLINLKNAIESAINTGALDLQWKNATVNVVLDKLLKPYLLGGHKVISKIKELDDLGLILLENKSNGKITILSISSYNAYASFNSDLLFGEVEFMKVYAFINTYFDELKMDRNKIEAIEVFDLQQGVVFLGKTYEEEYDKFAGLMKNKGLPIRLKKLQNLPNIIDTSRDALRNALRVTSGPDKKAVEEILTPIMNQFTDASSQKLLEVQAALRIKFPRLIQNTLKELSFNDEVEYIYALVSTIIIMKKNLIPHGDFIKMKDFAISFADFKSVFQSLYTDKQEDYDKTGMKIQGIIGGLSTVTPDKVPSADLRNINILINSGNSFVRRDYYKQSTVLNSLTRQYFKDIGYTVTAQNWIGNYRGKYENFWIKEAGDFSNIWSVKNPYKFDSENNLTDIERDHLKKMLFQINKYRLKATPKEAENADITSLDTLRLSNVGIEILNSIEDGSYFKMPLVRNQQFTRAGAIWRKGYKGVVDSARIAGDEIMGVFDGRELQSEESTNIKEVELGYYEMYDIYGMQSDAFKKEMIDTHSPQYYELSLDIIGQKIAFNKIRQTHMNVILPIVNSYMWWMKLRGGQANEDISKQLDYVATRVKLGTYDTPIVDPEFEDFIAGVSVVKRITTAGMLAFRPILLFKELTIGMYKGIALASTKIYGKSQFGHASFFKAVKILATIDNKMSTKWNMVDGLNNLYGFANRDVNTSVQKMQTSRRGILMGLSPWMYSMNTIPDYYNRMSLFMAKMIEEGSYDAHSMVDGFPVYDVLKDTRFTKYFKDRSLHMSEDKTRYIPAKNDEEYNKQRNLYNVILGELNEERERVNEPQLSEVNDLLPLAYSEKERLSYKSFTDTVYGYYDKDSQAAWHNTWYGIVFLQFMQFWPGKMSMWYGKKINAEASMQGAHIQKTRTTDDGKVIPIWRKPILSLTNPEEIVDFEETEENTGDPWIEWIGTPQEGLAQSILATVRYALTGDMGKFKSDKLLQSRFYYGIADGLLMMLLFGIIAALLKGFLSEHEGEGGIAPETARFMVQVNKRILSEANIYKNTFGALQTTPAFMSYGTQILGDIQDVFTGDKTMSDAAQRFKAFEVFNLQDI